MSPTKAARNDDAPGPEPLKKGPSPEPMFVARRFKSESSRLALRPARAQAQSNYVERFDRAEAGQGAALARCSKKIGEIIRNAIQRRSDRATWHGRLVPRRER